MHDLEIGPEQQQANMARAYEEMQSHLHKELYLRKTAEEALTRALQLLNDRWFLAAADTLKIAIEEIQRVDGRADGDPTK